MEEGLKKTVKISLFRWAGSWGPFSIKIPCGECTLSKDIIVDSINTELADIPLKLDIHEWLSKWWYPLLRGGWHAPIVMVEDRVISQGRALNRGLLTQAVVEAYAENTALSGNHIFGKEGCPHCRRAKDALGKAGIKYSYHDVVKSPRALYEMLARVKPLIGSKTPVTVPQIWLEGSYLGGADALSNRLEAKG